MAKTAKESKEDKTKGLSQELSKDIEYETNDEFVLRPIRSKNAFNDITSDKGFEFETTEDNDTEKDELDTKQYWTREEIMSHLESNPRPDTDICADSEFFDERIKYMETIYKNGVFKRVLRKGIGDVVTENSAVLYNLNAYLEHSDEPFDSTWLRGRPNLHKLSYDTLLPGLCLGLKTMRIGERSEIIVRPEYAYLAKGCPPRVPENSTILYIVEVIKVFEEGSLAHFETMDVEDRQRVDFNLIVGLCDDERISGNSYFKAERFREAAFRYRRAIRCLEQMTYKTPEDEKKGKDLLIKLYTNIANTYNRFGKPFNAMSNCHKALAIDRNCFKAHYQYGLSKMMNGDHEESKLHLLKALKQKPRNQQIISALQRLDQRMNGDRILEEKLYKKMGSIFVKK